MHITKEVIMQAIEHNSYIHSFAGTLVISYKELYSRIGKRVPHSENNIYGWEPNIFSTQINFDNPILLCLGGAGIDDIGHRAHEHAGDVGVGQDLQVLDQRDVVRARFGVARMGDIDIVVHTFQQGFKLLSAVFEYTEFLLRQYFFFYSVI